MGEAHSPFHPGEQALQARVGRRAASERAGRLMVRDFMPEEHRAFFASLPVVFAGSLDDAGRPCASVLAGAPGFLASPQARTLRITAQPAPGDPLARHLVVGAPLGLLGLEFRTRRRIRMNGTVTNVQAHEFEVRVGQSFGNCPKYIQARSPTGADPAPPGASHAQGAELSARAADLVARADTFFIASAAPGARAGDPAQGVDVSHRGGRPGFVRVRTRRRRTVLTAPDFAGNSLFNTFGNLALEPRCGLLFADFSSGDLLQLTGRAEVAWDGPELEAFAGAQRLLRFDVEEGLLRERALALRWTPAQQAAQLAATGSWTVVERALADVAARRHLPMSSPPDNLR
ncbi:MAG: pyridoxamine 5'-phosphate oxidase family protein [Betaproteobacteria bacterium]|nr:pyridoxamine 5'-phosphate oxidase family protein [Betaproteobacteria bacterium]MDH5221567.1 pyridoxamine 5'-phosphate oxidase family protein [Betaproteobacteria bacterium]MDH5350081.1 pyridoxamine 5'-phosphate oxidase family protein [Betaproteobacteria bacterium]